MQWHRLPPDQPVHSGIRHLAIHDAILSFTHKAEIFQHAAWCRVARVGLGLYTIQVKCVESPLQQGVRGLGGEARRPAPAGGLTRGLGATPNGRY